LREISTNYVMNVYFYLIRFAADSDQHPRSVVQSIIIEKPVVENIGFGFEMLFLSSVKAEIYVFPD